MTPRLLPYPMVAQELGGNGFKKQGAGNPLSGEWWITPLGDHVFVQFANKQQDVHEDVLRNILQDWAKARPLRNLN